MVLPKFLKGVRKPENLKIADKVGEEPVIGIDLGTTYSCVAVWRHGRVEIIPNDQGNRTTPSCVAFTNNERFIGEAAVNQATRNPLNTIFDVKRLIGRRFSEADIQNDMKLWPFQVIDGIDSGKADKPMIVAKYMCEEKKFTPEEISAMILAKMKAVAKAFLGSTVKNAVVTVPAYFNDSQRRATKDAGTIAGLNVVGIINEPTAAAMAYGLDTLTANRNKAKKNVLVFDLGGGTFDVSLVSMKKGEIQVKAISGDTHLGGVDFDNNLVAYLMDEFKRKYYKDISGNTRARSRLRAACEKAKRILSSVTETTIEIDCLHDGIDFTSKVSRARFEMLNMDLFRKCIDTVDKCLKDAKMKKTDVHDVVLVGGSTRIPKVQQLLHDYFDGIQICRSVNFDEAVACGAAVHAANLSGDSNSNSDIVLIDVTPLSLGIKDSFGELKVGIPKSTPLPVKKNVKWLTVADNQTSMVFEVYQGERPVAKDNIFLDKLTISGFPPKPRGETMFDVCYNIDTNGILNVSAVELGSGISNQVTITNHSGALSESEIQRMLNDVKKYEAQDTKNRELLRAKHALEDYANHIVDSLRVKNDNVKIKDKKIMRAVDSAFQLLELNSKLYEVSEFELKLKELQSLCRDAAF